MWSPRLPKDYYSIHRCTNSQHVYYNVCIYTCKMPEGLLLGLPRLHDRGRLQDGARRAIHYDDNDSNNYKPTSLCLYKLIYIHIDIYLYTAFGVDFKTVRAEQAYRIT